MFGHFPLIRWILPISFYIVPARPGRLPLNYLTPFLWAPPPPPLNSTGERRPTGQAPHRSRFDQQEQQQQSTTDRHKNRKTCWCRGFLHYALSLQVYPFVLYSCHPHPSLTLPNWGHQWMHLHATPRHSPTSITNHNSNLKLWMSLGKQTEIPIAPIHTRPHATTTKHWLADWLLANDDDMPSIDLTRD